MAEMNPKLLRTICRDQGGYGTPECNDVIYLHYRGWKKVEHLDEYVNLKVIYLEGNGFSHIQGLDNCPNVKSLYLQENMISKMENLEAQTELDSLNLSQNRIKVIENLSHMTKLTTLLLEKNFVKSVEDIEHVLKVPSLSVINLTNNKVDDPAVVELFSKMPDLRVLYLKGNPVVNKIKNYRKTIISSIKTLTYLDDRPVFPDERRTSEAWARGGSEAEKAERALIKEEKEKKEKKNMEWFTETFVNGPKYRGTNKDGNCTTRPAIEVIDNGEEEETNAAAILETEERIRSSEEERKTKSLFDEDFGVEATPSPIVEQARVLITEMSEDEAEEEVEASTSGSDGDYVQEEKKEVATSEESGEEEEEEPNDLPPLEEVDISSGTVSGVCTEEINLAFDAASTHLTTKWSSTDVDELD